MIRNTAYLSIPVMLLLLIVQMSILPHFPLFDLTPHLVLLTALSWSLLRSTEEGIIWAFTGGMLLDLYTSGPLGATPLAMMAAILVVAVVRRGFPSSHFILPWLYAGLATAVYLAVYLILLRLTGHAIGAAALGALMPLVLLNSMVMLPVYWLLSRVQRLLHPRRVEI